MVGQYFVGWRVLRLAAACNCLHNFRDSLLGLCARMRDDDPVSQLYKARPCERLYNSDARSMVTDGNWTSSQQCFRTSITLPG